jgi:hypothetical protein
VVCVSIVAHMADVGRAFACCRHPAFADRPLRTWVVRVPLLQELQTFAVIKRIAQTSDRHTTCDSGEVCQGATAPNLTGCASMPAEGHLTVTIHGTDSDIKSYSDLIGILENKPGRIVFNGFPTGVEISHAIVHGWPYPATSDGRCTP